MLNSKRAILLGLLILSVLPGIVGCGPMYQVHYAFTPPPTPEGRMCIMQCEQLRYQCRRNEDMNKQNCENQNRWARMEYERCKKSGYQDCYDGRVWCPTDYEHCDEEYRWCYQSCGGQVAASSVCVANCEQAPAPVMEPAPPDRVPPVHSPQPGDR
ncbi:MAG: hypothetical protein ABIJ50_01040 [Pseudomonadota bacterium]